MGIVLTKLWRLLWSQTEYKICIVGLDNAGKTTVLYRLIYNESVSTSPTIGSNVEELRYKNIRLMVWDIGGQESLRQSWSTYYVNSKAVIMVIDSSDVGRLHIAKAELHRMLEHEHLKSACLLVFANKQDVKDSRSAMQISEALALSTLKDRHWHIQGCCAITGEGLHDGLDWIVTRLTS
ncbi:ARF-like protein [Polychytrium aggregatum]|uniref:ARF-like protein n=1 Tax=Polychytrium aggregatum TaxID=110093 RepID=UPI0022FF0585|nr:ARF-like protein [Polychytrium aggregatum]KAI9199708.1 ARF-like protein [Polychytrium aggregatum]